MPIIRKDIEWSETEDSLSIKICLRGMNKKNTSFLVSSRYLKLSCPPFFWEVFLKDSVDIGCTVTRFGDSSVVFLLVKQQNLLWNELSDPKSDDKSYCEKMRMTALSEIQANAEQEQRQKQLQKSERDRAAVQLQLSLESEERKRINEIKESERKKMAAEIESWQHACDSNGESKETERLSKHQVIDKKTKDNQEEKLSVKRKVLSTEKKKTSKQISSVQPDRTLESLPSPRTSGYITVSFSPREFPTAARESKKMEEDKWLQKQSEARQCLDLHCSDLRPEEKNPIWLKDRGDDFYSKGDYLAAINAYSLAVRMCPKLPSLYSNRAACHLKCNNLHKTIEDTSKALELLSPPVEANAAARLKCHVRRGTAFCQLELYVEGLQDYEAALKIDPLNKQIQEDALKIRKVIQSTDG